MGAGPRWRMATAGRTLFCESVADVLPGVDHVIRLGLARGVAAIVTEAGSLLELSELPGLGVRQDDGDLYGVIVVHGAYRVGLDVAAASIDLSLDAPSEATVLEEASELQSTVELI